MSLIYFEKVCLFCVSNQKNQKNHTNATHPGEFYFVACKCDTLIVENEQCAACVSSMNGGGVNTLAVPSLSSPGKTSKSVSKQSNL